MSLIVGSVNYFEDATVSVPTGTSTNAANVKDVRPEIRADFTMADAGGGAGRLVLRFTWPANVTVSSFALHHITQMPADATWKVTRYSSTAPLTTIDESTPKPVASTYTAESPIVPFWLKPHAIHTFTTRRQSGRAPIDVNPAAVRGVDVTIDSPTGNGAAVSIGLAAGFETYALYGSKYNDGKGSNPTITSTVSRVTETASGGAAASASVQYTSGSFVMGLLSARDKNVLESVVVDAGLSRPVYLEFRPGLQEFRDRMAQGGIVRFTSLPQFSPPGPNVGTAEDIYSLGATGFTIWR